MRPLVCLHGFTGDPRAWDPVTAALPSAAMVVCPAISGHDRTLDLAGECFEGEVDRLAGVLSGRGLGPFHLAGYSLGGRLALGLLIRHRALFASATLIGAHPGLESEEARRERVEADEGLAGMLEKQGIESFIDDWERLPLFETQSALSSAVLENQRDQRLSHQPAGLAHALRVLSLGRMPSYLGDLRRLDLPIHLMVGEHDRKFCGLAEMMVVELPEATFEVVKGAGHNLVLEAPLRVAAASASGAGRA